MSPIPFEAPSLELLSELLPAYDFEYLIAQGNTGAVYKARQLSLERDVAIKILPRELGSDPLFRDAFESKAKAMARLSNNNLIKVYDYGDADGLLFSVMEYVHGKSLGHSAHGQKIDTHQAIEIVSSICRGLTHAHENGIIHRDIRPANILLTEKCEPKIGGFGITGARGYTAPEVLLNQESAGQRSDIFSIGILFKELLTGVPASTAAFEYTPLTDDGLGRIFDKATSENPDMRHSDVDSFCREIESWNPAKPASRLQVPAPRATIAPQRPALATASASGANWSLWKN